MEITKIAPRRKGLSQLYIDNEEAMKLDTQMLLLEGIKAGMELTDQQLHELVQKSDARRAQEKALYLLEYRSHSKKELADKIARTAATKEAAQEAANRMEDLGLIDDARYARDYARSLFLRKKFGSRRVKQELLQKGIDRDLADEILGEYAQLDTGETIYDILSRKYPAFMQDEKVRRRAVAALQRFGYSFEEIRSAMRTAEEME